MTIPGYPIPSIFTDITLSDDAHAEHHNELAEAANYLQAQINPFLFAAELVVSLTVSGASGQVIPTGSGPTAFIWTQETYDPDGWHSLTSDLNRLTCPANDGGLFITRGYIGWGLQATTVPTLYVRKNNTDAYHVQQSMSGTSSISAGNYLVGLPIELAAGEWFDVALAHGTTTATRQTLVSSGNALQPVQPVLELYRVGRH